MAPALLLGFRYFLLIGCGFGTCDGISMDIHGLMFGNTSGWRKRLKHQLFTDEL
jgi:hypothetical protein